MSGLMDIEYKFDKIRFANLIEIFDSIGIKTKKCILVNALAFVEWELKELNSKRFLAVIASELDLESDKIFEKIVRRFVVKQNDSVANDEYYKSIGLDEKDITTLMNLEYCELLASNFMSMCNDANILSSVDFITFALDHYQVAVEEIKNGNIIISVNEKEKRFTKINMIIFSKIQKKFCF